MELFLVVVVVGMYVFYLCVVGVLNGFGGGGCGEVEVVECG